MAERREEKYLLDYSEYSVIANRLKALLPHDKNAENGRYSICSLYFDDPFGTALAEKEDGNAVHIKFRVRTYNGSNKTIRLERKTKRGIVTEKHSAVITEQELDKIIKGEKLEASSPCFDLVAEMQSKAFRPAISVRYDREAYIFEPLGIRVTFDFNIDALPPEKATLFGKTERAFPAIERGQIIMEIKYSERCPSFIRKCCATYGMQLSVSKYALCRNASVI